MNTKHLSTCYSLNAQYKKAIEMDEDNCTAWERFDSTNPKAFRAQALKNATIADPESNERLSTVMTGFVYAHNREVTVAKLSHIHLRTRSNGL